MANYKGMAADIIYNAAVEPTKFALEYREGKNRASVNEAARKAFTRGRGKTDYELEMLETYLKEVFKPARARRNPRSAVKS